MVKGPMRPELSASAMNLSALGVAPAAQQFQRDHVALVQVDDGLVEGHELPGGDAFPQLLLQHVALGHGLVLAGVVQADLAAAAVLGAVERGVGLAQQFVTRRGVGREARDAHAGADVDREVAEVHGFSQALDDAFGG
jgi:hypothetical protein